MLKLLCHLRLTIRDGQCASSSMRGRISRMKVILGMIIVSGVISTITSLAILIVMNRIPMILIVSSVIQSALPALDLTSSTASPVQMMQQTPVITREEQCVQRSVGTELRPPMQLTQTSNVMMATI